ncbi:2-dehydro-3-deoxyglucarate aldolase : 4-hydroxy-2-oxovalerate aldolase OS=Isosphaera pallida (strain ATCC 43644 / DSM 9630 / IS1B) GN=Isop_1054 PE=4 SV=1: HpcH_HpaI [Gemmataceae bacterium]|nr:2-dehydro-3-deoxyglucarate aldolase : 4-hydroxy-2-oxovalerate aldolase OS=Isosphaera pallida (strain ATCC 43644 / DSM 9630 / IS1B) GN=Isop_1054 PE=4 SV=1: HpcH_HpaI [Gemmataceae bacterium]VTU00494.1 2-dehydro-3-deoxyglucarate aldolase : 4-hydroxy-2-oxovalerate aldolase OS=Isosphaera pallida (strain ATCC 43644 / DSM 9630 / IS1B) GN=Isop_1054 PE=4 SV=1: HpcH_HpaI [Gemmataceae bacterium]
MRTNTVKRLLREGKPAVGTWLSLGSVTAARFLARSGFDFLTVDVEHSLAGVETTTLIMGAVADAGGVPLVRVPSGRHDHIKRVLDNGGYGIVVPMVMSRQEAEEAVAACLYPPRGNRSVGGSVHALNFGASPADYYARVDDEILIVLQCEHIDSVRNFDEVYSVPGVDAVFVGPNDLMASMRDATGKPPSQEAFNQALADILAGCKRNKVAAGIHTFSVEEAKRRIAEGWQFIAINSELRFMTDGAKATADALGKVSGDVAKY